MSETDKCEPKKCASAHIAAMVLGIVSVVSALFWYITLPTGILAVVFGAKTSKHSGMGKAGLVLGIVGLSMFAFLYISMVCILLLQN
jgi:hypothetical protein